MITAIQAAGLRGRGVILIDICIAYKCYTKAQSGENRLIKVK
jgi:hypothetical protein